MSAVDRPFVPGEADRRGGLAAWLDRLAASPRKSVLALIFLSLAIFLPGIASVPPTDRDESRFIQATRQMHETGNYVDIRFQDEVRYKKPVGIYWLQAATTWPFGGAEAPIWAYRLPSLIGALVAVIGVFFCGRTLFGPREGLYAGLLFAPTLLLGVEAHLAKTDAALLAVIVVAHAVLARVWTERQAGNPHALSLPLALLFWAALGLGILIKGPIAPFVCAATCIGLSIYARSFRWLAALRPGAGVLLLAAIVLPWLIAIAIVSNGAFFGDAVLKDFLAKVGSGQESHGAPPGTYLALFPLTAWPLAVPVILAIPGIFRARRDPAVLFCLFWAIPGWIAFEAAATKLPHYILPFLPPLALLTGAQLARAGLPFNRLWHKAIGVFLLVVPAILTIALVAGPLYFDNQVQWAGVVLAAAATVSAGYAYASLLKQRGAVLVAANALSAALLALAVYQLALPRLESFWLAPRIAEAASRECGSVDLASAGYAEPSLVFAAGTTTRLTGPEGAANWLKEPGCRVAAVESRADAAFQARAATLGITPLRFGEVIGFNMGGGRPARIGLYRAGAGAP